MSRQVIFDKSPLQTETNLPFAIYHFPFLRFMQSFLAFHLEIPMPRDEKSQMENGEWQIHNNVLYFQQPELQTPNLKAVSGAGNKAKS
jgi:hypothetical protein